MRVPLLVLFACGPVVGAVPMYQGCVDPRALAHPYCNASLSLGARVSNLLSLLTLDDKINAISPARSGPTLSMGKESIGLPDYNWLTEANSVVQADCVAPDKCPPAVQGASHIHIAPKEVFTRERKKRKRTRKKGARRSSRGT